jgi:hypothetical protein
MAQRSQRRPTVAVPRACLWCKGEFTPARYASRATKFCSERCRSAKNYEVRKATGKAAALAVAARERYQTDVEYREEHRRRQRERGRAAGAQPRRPGGVTPCAVCSTEFPTMLGQRYCSIPCRREAGRERGKTKAGRPAVILMGHGEGWTGRLTARISGVGGMLVNCPECRWVMGSRDELETKYDRWCPGCGFTLSLNPEEVEWLVSPQALSA